jgi:hypothetical protein
MLNLVDGNWVSLCHWVEPKEIVGIYRTSIGRLWTATTPVRSYGPSMRRCSKLKPIAYPANRTPVVRPRCRVYHQDCDIVEVYVGASAEAYLVCRITYIPKAVLMADARERTTLQQREYARAAIAVEEDRRCAGYETMD